jgi:hypothetical protein
MIGLITVLCDLCVLCVFARKKMNEALAVTGYLVVSLTP